jgi:hypothetical protein
MTRFQLKSTRILRWIVCGAVAVLLPSVAQAVDPDFASFCNRYADDAVGQAKKNTEMKCGLEKENPDRWTSDRQAHFDWCISWDGAYAEPAREGSYRVVGLKDCAAKEAMQQGGVLSAEPGGIFKQTIPGQSGGGAPKEYATAIAPATIYKEPGGAAFQDANGDDIGMPVGSKAPVLKKQTEPVTWYLLDTPPLTPAPGWVYGDDVKIGP